MILGIDEVGRGPWAGPLVVGAVVLGGAVIDGLTDSKKLSKKRRNKLEAEIRAKAAGCGLGWVDAAEIDKIGLSQALKQATKQAVEQIKVPYHEIVIDGTVNFLADTSKGKYVTTMKKADLIVPSVSAASIIAKVARDNYMASQDEKYPGYNFKSHVGYGTSAHSQAIDKLGVTLLHRLSFAPLKKYAKTSAKISTKQIGDNAEDVACKYLKMLGYRIIDRNWKTKYCEIDIVAQKDETLCFCEVKYRKKSNQGDGLDAITKNKLHQMQKASKIYIAYNKLVDVPQQLIAISISGEPPKVDKLIEI